MDGGLAPFRTYNTTDSFSSSYSLATTSFASARVVTVPMLPGSASISMTSVSTVSPINGNAESLTDCQIVGCAWNIPANYAPGVFEACLGDTATVRPSSTLSINDHLNCRSCSRWVSTEPLPFIKVTL